MHQKISYTFNKQKTSGLPPFMGKTIGWDIEEERREREEGGDGRFGPQTQLLDPGSWILDPGSSPAVMPFLFQCTMLTFTECDAYKSRPTCQVGTYGHSNGITLDTRT
jgi:hypothetical protein